MPLINFTSHDGNIFEVHAAAGTSVMQAAVDNGIDGIIAECGGACSCATCHCYVDDPWTAKLDGATDLEKEMIECVPAPETNSRLSCQLVITDELDGMVVRLPERQY